MNFTLSNDTLQVVLSSFGGCIESIRDRRTGLEHYWQYNAGDWPRRTAVCFPICGALPNETYTYGGKPYHLHSHGFLRERELTPVGVSSDAASFLLTSDAETRENYPFDFSMQIACQLDGDSLIVRYIVRNTGSKDMYFSTGAHYTYAVPVQPGESYRDYRFRFSGVQTAGRLVVQDGRLAGITEDIFHGRDALPLDGLFGGGSTILRCCDLTENRIRLESSLSGAATEVSFDGFSHVVLWAPRDGAPFACIEPWAGMLDAVDGSGRIEEKPGIVTLRPDEARAYTQVIRV